MKYVITGFLLTLFFTYVCYHPINFFFAIFTIVCGVLDLSIDLIDKIRWKQHYGKFPWS